MYPEVGRAQAETEETLGKFFLGFEGKKWMGQGKGLLRNRLARLDNLGRVAVWGCPSWLAPGPEPLGWKATGHGVLVSQECKSRWAGLQIKGVWGGARWGKEGSGRVLSGLLTVAIGWPRRRGQSVPSQLGPRCQTT